MEVEKQQRTFSNVTISFNCLRFV